MSKDNYEGVTLALTTSKAEEIFLDSLCNGLDYLGGYGLSYEYEKADYLAAKARLKAKLSENAAICREDVLMEILRGGGELKFIDNENENENDSTLTIAMVHERVAKTPIRHITDFLEGNDDATTADCVLQTVLFNEIVFG